MWHPPVHVFPAGSGAGRPPALACLEQARPWTRGPSRGGARPLGPVVSGSRIASALPARGVTLRLSSPTPTMAADPKPRPLQLSPEPQPAWLWCGGPQTGGHHREGGERHCPPSLKLDLSGRVTGRGLTAACPRVHSAPGLGHKAALALDRVLGFRGFVTLQACAAMVRKSARPPVAESKACSLSSLGQVEASALGAERGGGGGACGVTCPMGRSFVITLSTPR